MVLQFSHTFSFINSCSDRVLYKKLVIIISGNDFMWQICLEKWFLSHFPILSKLSLCNIVHLLGRIPIILNIRAHCNFGHFKSSVSVVYQLHKEGMLASRVKMCVILGELNNHLKCWQLITLTPNRINVWVKLIFSRNALWQAGAASWTVIV